MESPAGKTFTETVYVHVSEYYGSNAHHSKPILFTCNMSDHGYICLGSVQIEYTVPEGVDILQKAVESVDSQIQNARAEFQKKLEELEDKKQQLLCIGFETQEQEPSKFDDIPF